MQTPHQAQGLQRLFSGQATMQAISVLSAPQAPDSHEFALALAEALQKREQRLCLVETGAGELSARLGCRPLLPWQAGRKLEAQVVQAGGLRLLYAPGCMAGEAAIVAAAQASRSFDVLLFDGGRFTPTEAPLEPGTAQTLVVLLGEGDAESAYALVKALNALRSPVRLLLVGKEAAQVAQQAEYFLNESLEYPKPEGILYHISNNDSQTSSNTLSVGPNLSWVVSKIMENDQPGMAYGGFGKKPSAKKV